MGSDEKVALTRGRHALRGTKRSSVRAIKMELKSARSPDRRRSRPLKKYEVAVLGRVLAHHGGVATL